MSIQRVLRSPLRPSEVSNLRNALSTTAKLIYVDVLDVFRVFVMFDVDSDGGTSDNLLREQVDALEREDLVRGVAESLALRRKER